jgi:tetratricopeptide (TPR) repeat protein
VLGTGAATQELAGRVRQVRGAVDAAVADSWLLVELDRIRLEQTSVKDGHFNEPIAAPLYAKALGAYGVDPAAPEAAAARVRGSRLREALLSALADWERVSQDEGERRRVEKVYQLALPPDSFRARLTAAVNRRDSAEVIKLAKEPSFRELPPASVFILAMMLTQFKEWAAAEQLLRNRLEDKPGDFWLNHQLGFLLYHQIPPRPEEAARYWTAALALRSDSPGVHLNLGNALKAKGDLDAAIRCYETALRIVPNYAMAHGGLGNALYAKKDLEGAIRCYRTALQINPKYANAHNALGNALHAKKDLNAAIDEYRAALRIEPHSACFHNNLGIVLIDKGDVKEGITELRAALDIDPKFVLAHANLGNAFRAKGDRPGAIAAYQKAIELKPDFASAHTNLGAELYHQGDIDGAIRCFRAALNFDPKDATAYTSLGVCLADKGDVPGALAAHQKAIALKPDDPDPHYNLGSALSKQNKLDEAIAAYREALRLKSDYPEAHYNLGLALQHKGQLDQAIAEYHEAIGTKQVYPGAYLTHYNLGNALAAKGKLDEAVAAYRGAIRLKKDFAEAHCNLGSALQDQGLFADAVRARKTGHELGSRRADWRYPSADWVREAERLVELDAKLSKVQKEEAKAADAAERLQLAWLCRQPYKQLNATAARFYAEAFDAEPKLAEDPRSGNRYKAACAAALAGCGQGKDADKVADRERTRLRQQALTWLRADLAAWRKQWEADQARFRPFLRQVMPYCLADIAFAGVHDPKALAKLPEAERQDWQKLWADVKELFAKAGEKSSKPEK